ncbi:hypothetical protein [Bifidobacterium saguini]|uniref:hypothetical protein n=1 Tax=Bifidobacterium saguini TaxID=762210 RepID=UPI0012E013FA|nr:hypothetical protein [Bifidobacterium saguini]
MKNDNNQTTATFDPWAPTKPTATEILNYLKNTGTLPEGEPVAPERICIDPWAPQD